MGVAEVTAKGTPSPVEPRTRPLVLPPLMRFIGCDVRPCFYVMAVLVHVRWSTKESAGAEELILKERGKMEEEYSTYAAAAGGAKLEKKTMMERMRDDSAKLDRLEEKCYAMYPHLREELEPIHGWILP